MYTGYIIKLKDSTSHKPYAYKSHRRNPQKLRWERELGFAELLCMQEQHES